MSAVPEEDPGLREGAGLTGEVIGGKYELERYIGSGAFGAVYGARHRILEKVVALKILRPNMARSEALVELFKREARAASRIDHPNSVRVLDFGKDASGLLFIVMELVEGPDLLRVLNEDFPLGHERVIEMMSQVLSALSLAHSLGVVHRDLKPENILVLNGTSDDGNMIDVIKICDFGIAQLSPAAVPQLPPRTGLEQPVDVATLVGTPEYMSPEQARSEKLDARSDVYSAGVLLFQLVTGRLPFLADTSQVVAMMQCSAQPPHPSWFRGVDPRFDTICLKAMSKDPKDRYQNAREMRAALRRLTVIGGDSIAPPVAESAPAPGSSTMNPPPSLPVARHSQLRLRRAVFVVAMTLASSAGAAAYLRKVSGERSSQPASMRGERSLPRAMTATKEPPPTIVVRDEPPELPAAVATTVTDFPALVVGRSPTPEPTNLGLGLASQAAPRIGRPVQGASASAPIAAAADSLPEVLSISARVETVESREGGASDRVATTDLEPGPEPSAIAAIQAASNDPSVPHATAPSRSDAIPTPAKKTPTRVRPEPLAALARIDDVNVRGSLATWVVQRAMDRARPLLSACYTQAAKAAGRNGFCSMKIVVEFDERGRARRAHADGAALPGLDRCVAQVAANLVAAQAPDTGTVRATWRVSFER